MVMDVILLLVVTLAMTDFMVGGFVVDLLFLRGLGSIVVLVVVGVDGGHGCGSNLGTA